MRKVLTWIGAATLLFVAVCIGGVSYMAVQGTHLDNEARLDADCAVRPVVAPWNLQALTERAAPELLANTKPAQLAALFVWFKTLGALRAFPGRRSADTDGADQARRFMALCRIPCQFAGAGAGGADRKDMKKHFA